MWPYLEMGVLQLHHLQWGPTGVGEPLIQYDWGHWEEGRDTEA